MGSSKLGEQWSGDSVEEGAALPWVAQGVVCGAAGEIAPRLLVGAAGMGSEWHQLSWRLHTFWSQALLVGIRGLVRSS